MATTTETNPEITITELTEFAEHVLDVARHVNGAGRFSEKKVWIHAVWAFGSFEPSLIEFKRLLVAAHRERLLTLCRLDLIEAADSYDVRRSRTSWMDCEWNLIKV